MYSFKQFLNENTGEVKTIKEVIAECQPFLTASKNRLVFRGMKNPTGAFTLSTPSGDIPGYRMDVRTDRRPLDSNKLTHDAVDDYMEDKFGWRGRSAGLFVTTITNHASAYGDVYMILPRGDFKFIWSPKVSDLITKQMNVTSDIEKELRKFKYQSTDLTAALNSGHEIMISCKDYYAIPYTHENYYAVTGAFDV
ncbi:hypothetical protein [Janthinobacterium sp.]|uniref:hypothetical protein n=1 Tax=Janthinobacterium sp. TaxID=1871054 RepID=UPI0026360812|nr:hypothetical protein [Janthinobacterium sp.]